ncbi:MAG TPA: YdbH domain-containing protein [Rhizomicrobium sp.]
MLLLLWVARARLAAEIARQYFQTHGIASSVDIQTLGLSGAAGRFALGPADAPDISAEKIELRFDPLRWMPYVVEVRLVNPIVRARMDEKGRVSLPNLQRWIESLSQQQGQSRFVSNDLAVSLSGLKVFLTSPYGALDFEGDLKMRRNLPLSAAFTVKPGVVAYQGTMLTVKGARLTFDAEAGRVMAHLAGSLSKGDMALEDFSGDMSAEGLRWSFANGQAALEAPKAKLVLTAGSAAMGIVASHPSLSLAVADFSLSSASGLWSGHADLTGSANADFQPDKVKALLATDRTLATAAAANLRHLDMRFDGHVEGDGRRTAVSLHAPLVVKGAAGGVLEIPALTVAGTLQDLHGGLKASLAGRGLPSVTLDVPQWGRAGDGWRGQASLTARFDYAMLHSVSLAATGAFAGNGSDWRFDLASCAGLKLASFRPGPSDLAQDISGTLCPSADQPLLALKGRDWRLIGEARDVSANLPLANVRMEKANSGLDFSGDLQTLPEGSATLTSAQMVDRLPTPRFHPVMGAGAITLKKNLWQGKVTVTSPGKGPLGDVTFMHDMTKAMGQAHITAPHLTFADGKLQPESLSPLLTAFKHADGSADFSGDVQWTNAAITSGGRLAIASLDFLTPLGKAHGVKTTLDFTSLLPPATKPGQTLAISRIDWTLPFTNVNVRFGFTPTAISVDGVDSTVAEGHATLGAFTLNLANPGRIEGVADIKSMALSPLISASNLDGKVKLDGKLSGHIPFTAGPDGFRIAKGRLDAEGTGRLSINRALWAQGDATVSANAVQDFAYQALENLSYEQLSADLNSVAGGRLQVVFKIKGRSDPPKPQEARVGLVELLNGTALQKPIPLPSNTPIDLTLDTSLNFDELLKSYAEAWSKTLSQSKTD